MGRKARILENIIMSEYVYEKQANLAQLLEEISKSDIVIGTKDIAAFGSNVKITFKADIQPTEKELLDALVETHTPQEEPNDTVTLSSPSTTEDNIPYVYASSRPMNHYVCFQGAGDSSEKIGGGPKVVFHLNSKTDSVTKDFIFNEDVHIKDGYMITKNAPMGAMLDIDVVHPQQMVTVGCFARSVPLFGSGWFPLDTEDRGFLPQGFIVRITISNSSGGDVGSEDEDYPADFSVSGRFELYRLKWDHHPSRQPFNR